MRVSFLPRGDAVITCILLACILENPVLAIAHRMGLPVNFLVVSAAQIAITAFAFLYVYLKGATVTRYYVATIMLIALCVAQAVLIREKLDLQFIYSISLLPIFTMLGYCSDRLNVGALKLILYVVVIVALLEAVDTPLYIDIFNPYAYYTLTRPFAANAAARSMIADSAGQMSQLYMGSYRTGGSFFGLEHRVGSLFLEPISLGYYAVITAITFLKIPSLRRLSRVAIIALCLLLAVMSDTRVAVFLVCLSILLSYILPRANSYYVYVLPAAIAALVIIGWLSVDLSRFGDLSLRLRITFGGLQHISVYQAVFGGLDVSSTGDSGILYLIANCGIVGSYAYVLLASGIFLGSGRTSDLSGMVLIYCVITLMFGGASMSIKTASVMGYGLGALIKERHRDFAPRNARDPVCPCGEPTTRAAEAQ